MRFTNKQSANGTFFCVPTPEMMNGTFQISSIVMETYSDLRSRHDQAKSTGSGLFEIRSRATYPVVASAVWREHISQPREEYWFRM